MRVALLLLSILSSCQLKEPTSAPGSLYYESWVFVGRDNTQAPLIVFANHRKTQSDKNKVELEAKVMMSKKNQTKLTLQERSSQEGSMSKTKLFGPMQLVEVPCGDKTCLQTSFAKGFVMTLQSEPLPALTPHDWRSSRIGDAITRATLNFEQQEIEGCLFVERGFSKYGPPMPFFGDFDWFALLDTSGDCWLLSDGARVGSFALTSTGKTSERVERQATTTFTEKKSGQTVASSWTVTAPALSLKATLTATSGHQGVGADLSPTKKIFYGHGSVEGVITLGDQSREVVGWIQHITDE